MYICSDCGKTCHKAKIYPGGRCQGCYNYYRSGGTVNPLPAPGTIAHDHRGYVICHICGRAYVRLGSHIHESHGMTIGEYKEKFGLCNNSKTTEHCYSQVMSDLAYKNEMDKRIIEAGRGTRIRKGETDKRLGKEVRLQEKNRQTEEVQEMKVYIAGGISNNPNYKKQFEDAEKLLSSQGHAVINPCKNEGFEYKEYIDMGLCELMKCDTIYMLKGWDQSPGAKLECA